VKLPVPQLEYDNVLSYIAGLASLYKYFLLMTDLLNASEVNSSRSICSDNLSIRWPSGPLASTATPLISTLHAGLLTLLR